jgi:hypothetical protein
MLRVPNVLSERGGTAAFFTRKPHTNGAFLTSRVALDNGPLFLYARQAGEKGNICASSYYGHPLFGYGQDLVAAPVSRRILVE